ncbi:hypothetical protein ACE02Y_07615 [Shewanella xiamenensis]|uniref:Lipoprotein n=2 Tax=Shewanella xiamenensis TaxID=332186 RepID=A0AAE4Q3P7_9GAMM|nr:MULTISPECIES: hypothetical protein [Shewanella]MDV5392118.1 hypothetical protein [Shewanella xiamenensis]PWH00989.1 hypothetical protein DIY08_20365 [Shewanella xiamenensis]BDQ64350.1 hypothetical protein NUITMVS2_01620 [Shewanella xiamenensis]GLD79787.1 hypothetical protein NUITMVS3_42230 [Shewanella xiamenensis]
MKKGCYVGVLVLLLGGCGGADDSTNSDSDGVIPPSPRLIMDVESTANMCNISEKKAGVDIIVHRRDGSILSSYKSDAQGHVDLPWSSEASHLTIAAPSFFSGSVSWDIRTELNAKAGDYGIYRFTDERLNSGCECTYINIDTSEIATVYSNYNLYANNAYISPILTYHPLHACKRNNKFAPVNFVLIPKQSGATAYAGSIDPNTIDLSQVISLSSSIFEGASHEGTLLNIDVNSSNYSLRSYSETEYGRQNWVTWATKEVQLFPELFNRNLVSASQRIDLGGNDLGYLTYNGLTRRAVVDTSNKLSLNLPLNENLMLNEVTRLMGVMGGAGNINYDFSFNSATMQGLQITLEQGNANWAISGPLKGSIPDLDLPTHLQAVFGNSSVSSMSFYVWGYGGITDLYDLRSELSKSSRSNSPIRSTKLDNYDYEDITISAY